MTNHNGNNPPPSMASLGGEKPPKRKYTRRARPANGPYVIEKGVPIPEPKGKKYPWDVMQVGDSFFVPNAPKSLSGSASKKREDGRTYTARTEKNGMRVWRTK